MPRPRIVGSRRIWLPDRCVTQGLRKAAARRLAEAGCSANEIAAITGQATLDEAARYTKAAEQRKLAQSAIDRLARNSAAEFPNPPASLGKPAEKPSNKKLTRLVWRSLRESNPSFQIENLTS